jgi:3-hydroxyisobutyrate dehydrogenase-like beta-hydroxyacid dehydrogenase
MRVAVIGLGTMGLPMAHHLAAAGYDVVGRDIDPSQLEALGVQQAETLTDVDAVLLSLPSPRAVEDVVLGPDGVRVSARPGSLLVDMSTSPPALARRLATECPELDVLDAPVSGGPRGAIDATLTIMVGGTPETFDRARPLFEVLGRLVVRVGGHGSGQAAKLCNNLCAGATMAALAEACAIAEAEGIEPATLYELLTASTGDSRVLRTRFPLGGADDAHPSSNDWAPLFALDLIAKDLGLALELADEHGLDARVASASLASYREAQRDGLGALDYSAVYRRGESARASD